MKKSLISIWVFLTLVIFLLVLNQPTYSENNIYKNTVTIACVNFNPVMADKSANLTKMEHFIKQAKANGANIVLFPEMALTDYKLDDGIYEKLAERIPGPSTERIAKIAAENNLYVIFGMPERDKKDAKIIYNSAAVIAPSKILGTYRKLHLPFGEKKWATAGSSLPVFKTPWGPIGVGICYDTYTFPEVVRIYTIKGARLYLNPTAASHVPGLRDVLASSMDTIQSRVIENWLFIASANIVGIHKKEDFFGNSFIAGPQKMSLGCHIIAGPASQKEEGIVIGKLDLSNSDFMRSITIAGDRQPKNYNALVSEEQQAKFKEGTLKQIKAGQKK